MTTQLDLTDIQGMIVRPYARAGLIKARHFLLQFRDGDSGREFLCKLLDLVTTSVPWGEDGTIMKLRTTTNVAFSFLGLKVLGVPEASLRDFPEEFIMGMKARRAILGDNGPSAPRHWDPVWEHEVHACVSINGRSVADIEERYGETQTFIRESKGGVVLLTGHRGDHGQDSLPYQEASLVYENGKPSPKEHFGYTDGIGDPVWEGQPAEPTDIPEARNPRDEVRGRGKLTESNTWVPLATGEFLLGHPDEAMEYPAAPMPVTLSRNGTFMAYRKLHQNVGTFERLLDEHGKNLPGGKEVLAAKFSGRWRDNGAPTVHTPDQASKDEWDKRFAAADAAERDRMLSDFTYDEDVSGAKCPISSHIRRINPRGALQFGENKPFATPGALDDRRRLIRRGLPYGEVKDRSRDDGNHGIVIMLLNASLKRQFEFVQQQWVNFGNDFKEANEKEVLLGNHGPEHPSKMVIQADPKGDKPPYFVANLPRLIETRGGEYFFIPSLTALRLIAKGLVDPT